MTFNEFIEHVDVLYQTQTVPGDLRIGQIFFNELVVLKPEIAEQIRNSMLDPFFKHRITQVTQDFVRAKW
jgi:hypothetical protein